MIFAYKLLVITIALAAMALVWKHWPRESAITPQLDAYYDYVIVGAGSAGCVLARRLSEKSNVKVAILEAGDEETAFPLTDIPLAMLDLQKTSADWSYKTVPQNNSCKGMNNRQSAWPRGKLLGGSSSINALMYVRGNRLDYDEWQESGCTGWGYEDIMPYFIKAETNRNGKFSKTKFHGSLGPLTVQDSMATPKLTNAFIRSGVQLGYPIIDVNGEKQIGVSHNQANIDWGRRVSSATAYLRPAIKRPNLHVATLAHVTKILFKGKTAIGVEYKRNGKIQQVRARKEVILSAGSIGSPQLLMLSGIGHQEHLEKFKIPVLADLPVGDNLQDHLFTDSTIYTFNDAVSITAQKAKGFIPLLDFLIFGQGFLTSGGSEGIAFSQSSKQPSSDKRPHLQLILFPFLIGNDEQRNPTNALKLNYKEVYYNAIHGNQENKEGCILLPVLLHPKSRGTVRLNNSDPMTPPDINPNYLSERDDMETLLDGIRLSQQFMESQYFKQLGAKRLMRHNPGCLDHEYDLDDYWRCYIEHNTLTIYHPVGSCKMGPAGDPTAVVDPELRVKGVKQLRVVDASIMPKIISGNPNAAVVMIAEKASDLIRGVVTVSKWGEEDEEDIFADRAHKQEAHAEL